MADRMADTTGTQEPRETRATRIRARLQAAFAPDRLVLIDESERHRGHAGWREGGETHFLLEMTAAAFAGKTRLERQRMVFDALGPELLAEVHAFSMRLAAPGET